MSKVRIVTYYVDASTALLEISIFLNCFLYLERYIMADLCIAGELW